MASLTTKADEYNFLSLSELILLLLLLCSIKASADLPTLSLGSLLLLLVLFGLMDRCLGLHKWMVCLFEEGITPEDDILGDSPSIILTGQMMGYPRFKQLISRSRSISAERVFRWYRPVFLWANLMGSSSILWSNSRRLEPAKDLGLYV